MNELLPLAIEIVNLDFPEYSFQIKREKNKNLIFDIIRRKYVVLTPEEWVRQHLIHYLLELGYPSGLMSIERSLPNSNRRYDLMISDRSGRPLLIGECKAPSVGLGQEISTQISSYLMQLPSPYFVLTNGLNHFFFERGSEGIKNGKQIPPFATISR